MTNINAHHLSFFKNNKVAILFALVLVSAIYLPVFNNLFTNWDDELYIVNNPYLKKLTFSSLKTMFVTHYAGNYHPFTMVSLAVNYKLSGIQPWSYQLVNLILHLLNTWLVYVFVKRLLTLKFSDSQLSFVPLITALLFGIHTFQVESVAWMSERKNVLYTFFFLASLVVYLQYLTRKSYKIYVISLLFFILSLFSKGMAVPLSVCIVLIDYFQGRKLTSKKVILEKIPYVALSLLFGYIAIRAQHAESAIRGDNSFSWFDQGTVAGYGFLQYIIKLIYPFYLSTFYPYPIKTSAVLPYPYIVSSIVSLFMLVAFAWFARKNKVLMFGGLFFLANIALVIQLLPVGDAVMADRYVYVASIGFFFLIAWFIHFLWEKKDKFRPILIASFILYCTIIGIKTFQRVCIWRNSQTLWEDALQNYPDNNDRGLQNLGNVFFEEHQYNKALQCYNRILQIPSRNDKAVSKAFIGKARINQANGNFPEALQDFNTSLAHMESYDAYLDRSVLRNEMEDPQGALNDLENAAKLDPLSTGPYINRGGIYYQMGNYAEAILNFNKVLEVDPNNSKAYIGIGQVKQALHENEVAMDYFNRSLLISPSYEGYLTRAVLRIEIKDYDGARADLDKAYQFDSLSVELYINKGVVKLNSGNAGHSLKEFDKAVKLNPGNYLVYLYRAIAKNEIRDYTGAIADATVSIQLHPSAEAHYYRSVAHRQLEHTLQAREDLNQSALMGNTVAQDELNKNSK